VPIESAPYINGLNAANPTIADPVAEWDDHMRLVKQALKATFPNITGAVSATHADLNQVTGTSGRVSALEGNRARVDQANTFAGTQTFATINATVVQQQGAALVPAGTVVAWYGNILAIPAGWLLCNGANGTPDLIEKFIIGAGGTLAVGAVGGANQQTAITTSSGTHNHGPTQPNGAHGHTATALVAGTHNHGGTQGHVLTLSEIPSHDHNVTLYGRSGNNAGSYTGAGWGNDDIITGPFTATSSASGSGAAHVHDIGADGGHSHTVTVDSVGAHAHVIDTDGAHTHTATFDNRPACRALVWIMKA